MRNTTFFPSDYADRELLGYAIRESSLLQLEPHGMNNPVSKVCCTREGTCACGTTSDCLPTLILVMTGPRSLRHRIPSPVALAMAN